MSSSVLPLFPLSFNCETRLYRNVINFIHVQNRRGPLLGGFRRYDFDDGYGVHATEKLWGRWRREIVDLLVQWTVAPLVSDLWVKPVTAKVLERDRFLWSWPWISPHTHTHPPSPSTYPSPTTTITTTFAVVSSFPSHDRAIIVWQIKKLEVLHV